MFENINGRVEHTNIRKRSTETTAENRNVFRRNAAARCLRIILKNFGRENSKRETESTALKRKCFTVQTIINRERYSPLTWTWSRLGFFRIGLYEEVFHCGTTADHWYRYRRAGRYLYYAARLRDGIFYLAPVRLWHILRSSRRISQ